MTNVIKTVLYTGVTADLTTRVQEHKFKLYPNSFTAKYNVIYLVYYCAYSTIDKAIEKEKRINAGSRKQKCNL